MSPTSQIAKIKCFRRAILLKQMLSDVTLGDLRKLCVSCYFLLYLRYSILFTLRIHTQ